MTQLNAYIDVEASTDDPRSLHVLAHADFPDPANPRQVQINRVDWFVVNSGATVVDRTQSERGDLDYVLGESTWEPPETPIWQA